MVAISLRNTKPLLVEAVVASLSSRFIQIEVTLQGQSSCWS